MKMSAKRRPDCKFRNWVWRRKAWYFASDADLRHDLGSDKLHRQPFVFELDIIFSKSNGIDEINES